MVDRLAKWLAFGLWLLGAVLMAAGVYRWADGGGLLTTGIICMLAAGLSETQAKVRKLETWRGSIEQRD